MRVIAVALVFASGALGGCAWLSGFDGDDYAVSPSGGNGGAGGAGGGSVGGSSQGGAGASSTGGSGATGAASTGGTAGSGGSSSVCEVGALDPGDKRVFVLKSTVPGDMGASQGGGNTGGGSGLSIADKLCTEAAEDAGLGAGPWVAYLSDFDLSAKERITGAGPWHLLDGTRVFNFGFENPINRDQEGCLVLGPVWTGTLSDGLQAGERCNDWTSDSAGLGRYGFAGAGAPEWQDSGAQPCSSQARLYCFEQ